MSNYFEYDEDEQPSDEKHESDQDNETDFEPISGHIEVDPLEELRQNLLAEEQSPQLSQPKPDLLRRMTGTLSSKKVPNKPKEPDSSGFGVRTAGVSKPAEPYPPKESPAFSEMNTESLRADAYPNAFNPRKNQPGPFTPQSDSADDEPPSTTRVQPPMPESKIRAPLPKPLDPLWDGATPDRSEFEPELTGTEKDEQAARVVDERRRLPSGFERQQQVSRFISYNPKRTLWERFKELSRFEKTLGIFLFVAIVVVIGLIGYLYIESRQPGMIRAIISAPSVSAPTAVVGNPVPNGLRLPGGWSFQVGSGMMVDGKWSPTKSEWLVGTEIRRVIAIPWNKQIEAVVHSFERGDQIELQMSNGDKLIYQVDTVISVPVTDSSVLYDTKPSLAIVLIQPDNPNRWVVIATP
jgi:hypothetical protein